jgi:transposase-like protein
MKRNTQGRPLAEEYAEVGVDPLLLQVNLLLKNSPVTIAAIANKSGVSAGTLRRWARQKTKRPQALTLRFALRAIGYQLSITKERP